MNIFTANFQKGSDIRLLIDMDKDGGILCPQSSGQAGQMPRIVMRKDQIGDLHDAVRTKSSSKDTRRAYLRKACRKVYLRFRASRILTVPKVESACPPWLQRRLAMVVCAAK